MLQRLARLFSLDSRPFFIVVCVLSVIPLWIPEYLPLVDAAQSSAQVTGLQQILAGNPFFTNNFEINWFTPYLGAHLLLYLISFVMPIVAATKLVVSAAVISLPVVSGWLLKSVGGDQRLKWLAIPGGYSFALYWGFLTFMVAVPIALGLLLLTIRFERQPTLRRGISIALYSVFLFYCHVIALGFGAMISLTYLLARNWRDLPRLIRCAIPYTAPLPLIAVWMQGILATEASVQGRPVVFGSLTERFIVLFTQFSGLDGIAFAVSLATVTLIILLPFVVGYRISKKPERWLPLAVGFFVYMIFPSYMQNTAYLFQRLAIFIIPLWLMVWEPPRRPSRVLPVAIVAVIAVWLGVNGQRFINFAKESESFATVMHQAEGGKRMAGMLFCNASEFFVNPVYLHFTAWYQAESRGISDMSFATMHPSLVRYRDMQAPRVVEQLAWQPVAFQWDRDGGPSYDYFIVCAGGDAGQLIFKDHVGSVELVAHEAPWWLYRNVDRTLIASQ